MFEFTDQLKNTIALKQRPKRIISLVPSQSELLWDLGLHHELVGITKFCIHPAEMFESVERVGGTKNLDIEKIRILKPDLIIGNKEENEKSQIEMLQKEFQVWMSDITNFDHAFEMIACMGQIFEKETRAEALIKSIGESLQRIRNTFSGQRVLYFIWNKPYMVAGTDTFIHHVLTYLGLVNAAATFQRYPQLNDDELLAINPELCFLSSEPFPFKKMHITAMQKKLPGTKIRIVDGEVFSWYGSRLLHLEEYVKGLQFEP
ncbi:MAG TPA: helical backbone metal receptor [Bacteroidia bacterium]|nr:helical backbone metal receptor [Bacteroidia bacterium]